MSTETDASKSSKIAVNDITGDSILTRSSTEKYRDNWDKIFGKTRNQVDQKKSSEEKE